MWSYIEGIILQSTVYHNNNKWTYNYLCYAINLLYCVKWAKSLAQKRHVNTLDSSGTLIREVIVMALSVEKYWSVSPFTRGEYISFDELTGVSVNFSIIGSQACVQQPRGHRLARKTTVSASKTDGPNVISLGPKTNHQHSINSPMPCAEFMLYS